MLTRAAKTITAFASLLAVAACSVFGSSAAPEPEYTVVLEEKPFEIRDYGELVVAKTSMADGSRAAFGRLFEYISGQNSGTHKIAMTAPVLNTVTAGATKIAMTAPVLQSGEVDRKMVFVLTYGFTLETAPVPTDPQVSLATIPPRRVAVVRYAGSLNKRASAEEARLRDWLADKSLKPEDPAEVAGYNPPWTLPGFRRNEILIPIARDM